MLAIVRPIHNGDLKIGWDVGLLSQPVLGQYSCKLNHEYATYVTYTYSGVAGTNLDIMAFWRTQNLAGAHT